MHHDSETQTKQACCGVSSNRHAIGVYTRNKFCKPRRFGERRQELSSELQKLEFESENLASIALYFGGEPVQGSRAIEADFAANALASYQEIVTKVWTEGLQEQSSQGIPKKIPKEASHLHITDVVHGSFGFVLEEIDIDGAPFLRSALKDAMDKSVEIISGVADKDDDVFADVMAVMNLPILTAVRDFYRMMGYKSKAVFRVVEGRTDQAFDIADVERAYERAEQTTVEEEEFDIEGELLGMIPIGRRFEFKRKDDGRIISGKVGRPFSQDYLDRVSNEQLTAVPAEGFSKSAKSRNLAASAKSGFLRNLKIFKGSEVTPCKRQRFCKVMVMSGRCVP